MLSDIFIVFFHFIISRLINAAWELRGCTNDLASFVKYVCERLSWLDKHDLVVALTDYRFLHWGLLILLGMQLQAMDYFCCSLSRVYEIYLDTDIKLTPTCLMNLKWEFFNSYNRLREGGMELEDDFFDKVRDVLVIVESSYIAWPFMSVIFISFLSLPQCNWTNDDGHMLSNSFESLVWQSQIRHF